MTDSLCSLCQERPKYSRYLVCNRCRHSKEKIPCACGGSKRPGSRDCVKCCKKRRGPAHGCWKGGRVVLPDGYIKVWCPEDPRNNNGYVKEHTLVMESLLQRKLFKGESVHHRNGNRADNRPENLELWSIAQPAGQRVEDKIKWAIELLKEYRPNLLK